MGSVHDDLFWAAQEKERKRRDSVLKSATKEQLMNAVEYAYGELNEARSHDPPLSETVREHLKNACEKLENALLGRT